MYCCPVIQFNVTKIKVKTIGVPIVTGLPRLYQQCTNGVQIVKNSQKQSKDSQNSKNDNLVYQSSHVYQDCTKSVLTVYQLSKTRQKLLILLILYWIHSQNTVKTAQKWPLVYQSSHVYQDCTNRVPTVYQKQSKDSQNSKNDHWCTNRHKSTKTVPTV